jgi:serine/threonine-protein kinase ULK/ATG1
MAFCSGGDLSIYIKKRGRLPTLDFPRVVQDGTTKGEMGFWPHPDEGGLDAVVTRCFLGQLSG